MLPIVPPIRKTMEQTNLLLAANSDTVDLGYKLGVKRAELYLDSHLPEEYCCQKLPIRTPTQELRLLSIRRLYPRKALVLAL